MYKITLQQISQIIKGKDINELKQEYREVCQQLRKFKNNGVDFNADNLHGEPLRYLLRFIQLNELKIYQNNLSRHKSITDMRKEITKNRSNIIQLKGNKCYLCGFDYHNILCIHHIIPIACGGSNDLNNLCVLCPNCHAIVHKIYSSIDRYCKKNNNCIEQNEWIQNHFSIYAYKKLEDIIKKRYNI